MNGESWIKRNLAAILGTALQLLILGIYIGRQEQIIADLERRTSLMEQRMLIHNEDANLHTTSEWRANIMMILGRLEGKIDTHISHEPGTNHK